MASILYMYMYFYYKPICSHYQWPPSSPLPRATRSSRDAVSGSTPIGSVGEGAVRRDGQNKEEEMHEIDIRYKWTGEKNSLNCSGPRAILILLLQHNDLWKIQKLNTTVQLTGKVTNSRV